MVCNGRLKDQIWTKFGPNLGQFMYLFLRVLNTFNACFAAPCASRG